MDKDRRSLQRVVWALLGFVIALTLVVLLLLPYIVAERAVDDASISSSVDTRQPAPLAVSVTRHDAELALQDFLRLRAQPDLANVELWAVDDWQAAMDIASTGDDHYGGGRFNEALSAYKMASLQMQALLDSRKQRLAGTLDFGVLSLQQNNVDEAISAFERVLVMQQDHRAASLGLARARVRSDVLKLMEAGRQAEAVNNLQLAASSYIAALKLDPAFVPAQEASQQIDKRLASLAFQNAMSHALQSLDRGELADAKDALTTAAKIYPDAPAVKDARQRLAAAQREFSLNKLRRQATLRAANENWSAAADLYSEALIIDTQAAFADSGLDHAQQRMKLHAQLDHYLADTTRLYSAEPLANARKLLAANRQIPDNEPALARKVAQLQEAVRLAVIPVELLIRSDNQTEVLIYHVGRLGRFTEKKITLRPGRYTVTGTRAGFRDVRKVVNLRPDSAMQSLLIRCEEPI